MSPEAILLAMQMLQLAIKEEPAVEAELRAIFSKGTPTPQDWAAFESRIRNRSYKDFVPATDLPASITQ